MGNEMNYSTSFLMLKNKILAFSQDDIIQKLPASVLQELKKRDEHPFLSMYSICHEGVSTPTLIGEKARPITWTRKAVQSIKDVVVAGIKLFNGHNSDNSTDNRRELGEIIHSFQEEIDGKLHHMIIAYHPQGVKDEVKNYDICSQEAEWNFFEKAGNLIASTIDKLTGIALGNSQNEQPAFSGARRFATVQAFENKGEREIMSEQREISFQDVKRYIKEHLVYPWQLFDSSDLKEDREFGKIFKEYEEMKVKLPEYEKKVLKFEDEIKMLTKSNQMNTAKNRLEKIFQDEPIPEKMKLFVEKSFELEKEKINDLTDAGLKNFVKSQKEYFQIIESINNPEPKDNNIEKKNKTENVDRDDFTKVENNEFLTEDFEI